MSELTKPIPDDYGCNCDYYGADNCLRHNSDHPTHQIYRLKDQLLTQAEEIRRLREALEHIAESSECYHNHFSCRYTAKKALKTPTPTTWGQKALDVVDAGIEWNGEEGCNCDEWSTCSICIERQKRISAAVSELQKERTS